MPLPPVSTNSKSGLREDLRNGRSIQIPKSTAGRVDAAAAHFGITSGHLVRLLLDYALRDHEAGFIELQFPPAQAVRRQPGAPQKGAA